MAPQDTIKYERAIVAPLLSCSLAEQLTHFARPLLVELDEMLDKRLVRTFLNALSAIVRHRHRNHGLLLSELGTFLLASDQAPAGTKRLSNLLRSKRWTHEIIEHFLWHAAGDRLSELEAADEQALLLWDESVIEKPESIALEGLCAVRSSKATRLKRIKPGFYNPPDGRPVFVPGLKWLSVMLMGSSGAPTLASMRFWTTRGEHASDRRTEEENLLKRCADAWGRRVMHLFDRGYAGEPWLRTVVGHGLRFVLRWPKSYKLVGPDGREQKAWQITRGRRSLSHRMLFDARHQNWRKTGVYFTEVRHKHLSEGLYLVVSRPGHGREPWYLLTNEPVANERDAWRIVLYYARRWQIEMLWRYAKSELAMESPRLWFWENRLKLLSMVALVYAFLVSLLRAEFDLIRRLLLRHGCHRTGKRSREASTPLYRIRLALSHLWQTYRPNLQIPTQTPG